MDVGVHYANFSHPGGAELLVPRLAEIQKTIVTAVDPLADVDGFVGSMEEYAALRHPVGHPDAGNRRSGGGNDRPVRERRAPAEAALA